MPNAQGTSQSLIFGPEASLKTLPGTVNADLVPVVSPTSRPNRNTYRPQSLTGSPEPRPVVLGKVGVDYEFGVECNPASMQAVLHAILGGRRQYGLGPVYATDHYLTAPMISQFLEQRHADIGQYPGWRGCLFGSLGLSMGSQGIMEGRVGVKAAKQVTPTATATVVNGTLTDRTGYEPFSYLLLRVKKGGSTIAYSQQVDLNLDRKIGMEGAQDQTNEQAEMFSEVAEISGSMLALFPNATMLDDSIAGGETSIEIWIPGIDGWGCLIEAATMKFRPFQLQNNGTGLVKQRADFDIYGKTGVSKYPGRAFSTYWKTSTLPALNTLTLVISVDGGGNQTVTFTTSETTVDAVVTKINADTTGLTASADRAAGDTGGVIRIESDTKGTTSSIQVQASSTADTVLGFDNNVHSGLDGKSILFTLLSPLAL
jgi:hypothetical protein